MKLPSAEARLSEGCEKSSSIKTLEMILKFFKAASLLQQPLEELIGECLANFLVADMMFPWAAGVAGKFGIPRLENSVLSNKMDEILQAELESYGVIVNSFHELEPAYSEHYKKALADSGENFIRVVKNGEKTKGEDREEWLPEGFEKREVLKVRVAVGAQEWSRHEREILVKREEIEMAIIQLLVGEEAEELRNRAQALREMAMRTTEEEGSSCCNLKALLKELRAIKTTSF
ncbi:hypothetical protein NC653_023297 [Populus alba x Populus x berolinensis]|uniref:Uncharacterized protein n=2 Tax=Populus TaxID=3689 RepID=A0A4U5Q596_POPAL|nr:hypothetical protein NC653_023297 [Populus alba x Populus x berolinensis]TKS05213.1 hypothetical protein D5086_0000133100 [Populus alba]